METYTYVCSNCHRELPREAFHVDSTSKGHYSVCKKCRAHDPRSVISNLIGNARKRANRHNLPCTISRQYILDLNNQQSGKCALTGVRLNWSVDEKAGKQRVCPPDRVSVDRINPLLGYVPGNVQLVTDFANRIKTWYPQDDFVEFCRLVVENAGN